MPIAIRGHGQDDGDLDQMSEGRVIAGVGAGWNAASCGARHTLPYAVPAQLNTPPWQACWVPDPITFQGQFFSSPTCTSGPTAAAASSPDRIGGASLPRCAVPQSFAQVWQPTPMTVEALRQGQTSWLTCSKIGHADIRQP